MERAVPESASENPALQRRQLYQTAGGGNERNMGIAKTEQPAPRPSQPPELGRGVSLSTQQTKGERPDGLGSGGVALHSLFRVLCVRPALSWTAVAFGPLGGQDRYPLGHKAISLVTCSCEMSAHRQLTPSPQGAFTHLPGFCQDHSGGERKWGWGGLHCLTSPHMVTRPCEHLPTEPWPEEDSPTGLWLKERSSPTAI